MLVRRVPGLWWPARGNTSIVTQARSCADAGGIQTTKSLEQDLNYGEEKAHTYIACYRSLALI